MGRRRSDTGPPFPPAASQVGRGDPATLEECPGLVMVRPICGKGSCVLPRRSRMNRTLIFLSLWSLPANALAEEVVVQVVGPDQRPLKGVRVWIGRAETKTR